MVVTVGEMAAVPRVQAVTVEEEEEEAVAVEVATAEEEEEAEDASKTYVQY